MRWFIVVLALWLPSLGYCLSPEEARDMAKQGAREFDEAPDADWAEARPDLPLFPKDADLVEFYVSAGTRNHFFIDATTLSVGADGVVHYVLLIRTAGGATNVSFEGIRCKTGEYKIYATGRSDGTWVANRRDAWRMIEDKNINRYHAALNRELFCPQGLPIKNADEGREALHLGKNPRVP